MMMNRKYDKRFFILLLLMPGIMLCSCSIFEPSSPVGSFIHVDSISVQTDYPTQGSNSNRITDAWVVYDNQYLGTFPLPADIPLIGEGNHSLIVKGGILVNGISGTRASYPKYSSYEEAIVLTSGKTITIEPVVGYGSAIQFPQIEDFDDASLSLVTTGTGTAPLLITQQTDPNAFEGNSGVTTLDSANTIFEVASSSAFTLPLNVPSYLELNYKSDIEFIIGVFISTQTGVVKSQLLSVRSSSAWKKIYVNLSELGGVATSGIDYKIYLHSDKPASVLTANLYFDNLKVVF